MTERSRGTTGSAPALGPEASALIQRHDQWARVVRWAKVIAEKPVVEVGPSTFQPNYEAGRYLADAICGLDMMTSGPTVQRFCGVLACGDDEYPCVLDPGHDGHCDFGQ